MKHEGKGMIKKISQRRKIVYYLLLPSIITLIIFTLFPFFYNLWASVQNYDLIYPNQRHFIGINNFIKAITNEEFWSTLKTTLYFSGLGVILQLLIGLGVGLLFGREFKGKNILRTLLILPMVAMPVATAYIWRIMFSPSLGIINYILQKIGLQGSEWIAGYNSVIPSLVVVDTWQWSPFMILIISSGLMSLPKEPYEAAKIEGATGFQTLKNITLPLLKPILSIAFVFRLIDSFRTFDIIYSLTGGGPGHASETLNINIYLNAFRNLDIGYSGALVIIFLFIINIITMFVIRRTGFEESILK
ncbi:MAG TPA: sugar ABC transporter permease [Candidatus Atribacteria bacterium]|nr:sugar ABC transporter permease [Candidatus Atribacteria bacterium]